MQQKISGWIKTWNSQDFTPKFFTLIKEGISLQQLRKDVLAGIIVGIVALPLAIAFAIASGVSPEKGLITAVVAGFIISVFGGSRVQIGGPTGAFIVIVYGIVQQYGIEGLTVATFIAGFILLAMGFLKLGNLLKFIPHPLTVGFTCGIAIIIFSSQIGSFFGLDVKNVPADFLEKWLVYARHLSSVNLYAAGIGTATVLFTVFFPKITTRIPGSLIAIIACTMVVQFFHLPVETIESKFGEIPNRIPVPQFYAVDMDTIRSLLSPALAIALLGGIESLLSAVVADGMTGGRHRSNMELVAQGAANIASSMLGGIPATGAIARTATNVKNGGRTPVSGIVHAITLLVIMLVAAPLAKLIPLACLAGILIVVSYNMGEWHAFASVFKGNLYDRAVLLTVFLLTLIFDLVIAIEIGMVLSAFLFIKRMSDITQVNVLTREKASDQIFEKEFQELPPKVMLFEISGPLFFGASQKFQETLKKIHQKPEVIILNLRNSSIIDATGIYRLMEVIIKFKSQGTEVYITGYNTEVEKEMRKGEIDKLAILQQDIHACIEQVKGR